MASPARSLRRDAGDRGNRQAAAAHAVGRERHRCGGRRRALGLRYHQRAAGRAQQPDRRPSPPDHAGA